MWPVDHVALGALDLEREAARLSARLGVPPAGGGAHPTMGTWNRLWRLGDAYLELIAVDPAAPHPGRPRWFGLDDPATAARLAAGPALLGWVLRVPDLAEALALCPVPPGLPEEHHRGTLRWSLTVPAAGAGLAGGTLPLLIEWPPGTPPPPAGMPDTGLRLLGLRVTSPLAAAIRALPLPPDVAVADGPPALAAELALPGGGRLTLG